MDPSFGRSILILEDEPSIAMDLESALADAGLYEVIIRTSCHDAAIWLSGNSPSVAILDIDLKRGSCENVAKTLIERQIPFLTCSAHHQDDIHQSFIPGQFLSKPFAPYILTGAVRYALGIQRKEFDRESCPFEIWQNSQIEGRQSS